jgi:pimeloyl-ACP methyl ester carboxylesterase
MNVLNQRSDAAIATEDFFVPSDTAGIDLHLRRKRLAHVETFPRERTLLLMHGATFSSGSLFDAPVGGASFMDQLAVSGFDVYAADVRGYGASTWPPQMAEAVDPSTQPVRIETRDRLTFLSSLCAICGCSHITGRLSSVVPSRLLLVPPATLNDGCRR